MIRLAIILAVAFSFCAGLCLAQLSDDRQANLDGAYAGIHQKRLLSLQQQAVQGSISKTTATREIQLETDYIARLRNRWRPTKYRTIFENSYQREMAGLNGTPVQRPLYSEPFKIPFFFKAILVIGGYWICKRLWKASPGLIKGIQVDYGSVKEELSAAEQAQLKEAQEHFERRNAELGGQKAALEQQVRELTSEAASIAARAGSTADGLVSAVAAEFNHAVPEYKEYLARLEQRLPAALAPWSSDAWMAFAREPKPEVLHNVSFAHFDEANLLPGEIGITSPWTIALLAAKGPIVVRCDAASKSLSRSTIQNIVLRAALASPAEMRFSLIDPMGLGSAFPMRGLLPRVRTSARTPADELAEIVDDIRRINEAVVGQAESFASLSREKRAGETFELIVALDYPRAYERDPRALEYLARIAQSGPRAGRHLILEWDGQPSKADLARFENHELIDTDRNTASCRFDPVASADQQRTLLTAVAAIKSRSTGGDWNAQIRPETLFAGSSARMVETPVGERLRIWFGDNADGKPCAHAMLAGQTGSGKSFLLHVFITGLAARYSPSELRLVLVDGKQGVEFEAYKTLPHAQVVCLRTSPAIARSVLEDFMAEMEDRYVKFQQQGVTKLEDFRRKTGAAMPRMLMVVDEYQQLLEGDPDRGAQMLSRVLEKGRAAGIHLVLGSQTFEVRGLPASAMTHVHLRAALSLPVDYIQAVTAFGAEGKKLIRDLAPSGHVVINDESGRDGANARGAVARLDAAAGCSLGQVVSEITASAGAPVGTGAVVLSGNDAAVLADNPFVRLWRSRPPDPLTLQATARRSLREGGFGITSWSSADRPLPLWLGRKFDVHGHLVAALRRANGHNLLALGSDTGVRLGMLANSLAALRSMRSLDGCHILVLDGLMEGQPGAGMLSAGLDVLRAAGARAERATPDSAASALEQFAAIPPVNPDTFRLLVLSEPEYFPALAAPAGFGAPPPGPSRVLKELLRAGPAVGTHAIITASGMGALSSVLHPSRDAALFNHRVVQQSNEEESMTLFSSLAATRIMAQTDHHMAGMYVDTVQGVRAAQLFKAYAANAAIYGDQSPAGLSSALRNLYGVGAA